MDSFTTKEKREKLYPVHEGKRLKKLVWSIDRRQALTKKKHDGKSSPLAQRALEYRWYKSGVKCTRDA